MTMTMMTITPPQYMLLIIFLVINLSGAYFHAPALPHVQVPLTLSKSRMPVVRTGHSNTALHSGLILGGSGGGGSGDSDDEIEDRFGAPIGPLPTASSRTNFAEDRPDIKHDLWIVGCGELGYYITKQWLELFPDAKIVAETQTPTRHAKLSSLGPGCSPRLRQDRNDTTDLRCACHVIVALPPSKTSGDYYKELADAHRLWGGGPQRSGLQTGGSFILTSSVGVYGDSKGNIVNEDFRLDTMSSRSTAMVYAEEAVLVRGGAVVRLAGLYDTHRGPHTYWMKAIAPIDGPADGIINMLHYEDAASAVVATALKFSELDRRVFLASDNHPVTRREICESALASGAFPDARMPEFTAETGPKTKICDSQLTRRLLGWAPKYQSFPYYMRCVIGGAAPSDEEEQSPVGASNVVATEAPSGEPAAKKSALWLPGDDDDLLL